MKSLRRIYKGCFLVCGLLVLAVVLFSPVSVYAVVDVTDQALSLVDRSANALWDAFSLEGITASDVEQIGILTNSREKIPLNVLLDWLRKYVVLEAPKTIETGGRVGLSEVERAMKRIDGYLQEIPGQLQINPDPRFQAEGVKQAVANLLAQVRYASESIAAEARAPGPVMSAVRPAHGISGQQVQLELIGNSIQAGAKLYLEQNSKRQMVGQVNAVSESGIQATISLSNVTPGLWNLTVENPDGRFDRKNDYFTVYSSQQDASLAPSVISPESLRLIAQQLATTNSGIRKVQISEREITLEYLVPVKLFWLFPLDLPLSVVADTYTGSILLRAPWWKVLTQHNEAQYEAISDELISFSLDRIKRGEARMDLERNKYMLQEIGNVLNKHAEDGQ